ncbi:MAG TPA: SEC59/DGK1/VTE5 family protein [Rectinemataceae bacterium]
MKTAEQRQEDKKARSGTILPFVHPRGKLSEKEKSIELTRKSIHLSISLAPFILSRSKSLIVALLVSGCTAYAVFETLRRQGLHVPLISELTSRAARFRDSGKFVLGPITLGIGALLPILLFDAPAASVAIYVLAFGDGLSSLVGKFVGGPRMPFTKGKTVAGSFTCFAVSFLSAFAVLGKAGSALIVAAVSTIVEAAPTKDWDNIILPLAAGLAAAVAT